MPEPSPKLYLKSNAKKHMAQHKMNEDTVTTPTQDTFEYKQARQQLGFVHSPMASRLFEQQSCKA